MIKGEPESIDGVKTVNLASKQLEPKIVAVESECNNTDDLNTRENIEKTTGHDTDVREMIGEVEYTQ